jgi:hypothetical protein
MLDWWRLVGTACLVVVVPGAAGIGIGMIWAAEAFGGRSDSRIKNPSTWQHGVVLLSSTWQISGEEWREFFLLAGSIYSIWRET